MNTRAKLHGVLIAGTAGALALVVLLGSPAPSATAAPPVVSTAPYPGQVVVIDAGAPTSVPLAGSGEPGETIDVSAQVDGDGYPLCSATVQADGTWSCLVTEAPDFRGPVAFTNGVEVRELDFGLIHAPRITADASDPTSLTSTQTVDDPSQLLAGSGVPGALVTIELTGGGGCSATVDPAGLWSCSLTALPIGAGPFSLIAGQSYADAPSQRAFAEPVTFVVGGTTIIGPGAPTPPDPPAPVVPDPAVPAPGVPAPVVPSVPTADSGATAGAAASDAGGGGRSLLGESDGSGSDSNGASAERGGLAGDSSEVVGSAAGSENPNGTIDPSGAHRVGAGTRPSDGWAGSGVVGGSSHGSDAAEGEAPSDGSTSVAAGEPAVSSLVERGGEPSEFGLSLATVNEVVGRGAASVTFLGALIAGVVLLVILPGGLLEATVHDNLPRIRRSRPVRALLGRLPRQRRGRRALARTPHSRTARSALGIGAVLAVGALASVAVSPAAAFDPVTVRLFLAFLVASIVANGVPLAVSAGYALRRAGVRSVPYARPTVMVLTVVSVVVSRVVGLEPGFVFGAVIALQLGSALSARRSARLVVVSTSALLALGVVAWLAQNWLRAGALQIGALQIGAVQIGAVQSGSAQAGAVGHSDVFSALLLDTATAVTVCALSGPIVSLLPMRFLDGAALFRRSKAGWVALYAVSAGIFGLVLLPLPDAWSAIGGDQLLWFAALALFALLSVGVWAWFRFVPERAAVSSPSETLSREVRQHTRPTLDPPPESVGTSRAAQPGVRGR